MAPYKNSPPDKELGDYFDIYTDIKGIKEPDATGERNDGHVWVLQVNYMLDCVQSAFSRDDKHYDDCPGIGADKNHLKELSNICKSDVGRLLFSNVRAFQGEAVKNPNTEVSTESLILRFVGVDEADQKGAGSVLFDLLLKGGTVNEENIRLWTVALDYKLHRNYVLGMQRLWRMWRPSRPACPSEIFFPGRVEYAGRGFLQGD